MAQADLSEPLLELVHGEPGTGKSAVLKPVVEFFEGVMGWTQGNQSLCADSLTSMAAGINGTTLHSGADIPMARDDDQC